MSKQRQGEETQQPVDTTTSTRPEAHDDLPREKEGEFATRHPSADKRMPPARSGGMDLPGMESEEKEA